jgi:hypothetical protein
MGQHALQGGGGVGLEEVEAFEGLVDVGRPAVGVCQISGVAEQPGRGDGVGVGGADP